MTITFTDNRNEETFYGPYDRVAVDSHNEDGLTLLGYHGDEYDVINVPFVFDIIPDNYMN